MAKLHNFKCRLCPGSKSKPKSTVVDGWLGRGMGCTGGLVSSQQISYAYGCYGYRLVRGLVFFLRRTSTPTTTRPFLSIQSSSAQLSSAQLELCSNLSFFFQIGNARSLSFKEFLFFFKFAVVVVSLFSFFYTYYKISLSHVARACQPAPSTASQPHGKCNELLRARRLAALIYVTSSMMTLVQEFPHSLPFDSLCLSIQCSRL